MVRLELCVVNAQSCHDVAYPFGLTAKEEAELSKQYAEKPQMATIHTVLEEKYGKGNVAVTLLDRLKTKYVDAAKYAIAVNMPD